MFIEGIMGSPEGTSGPQPCLQGVVGYTTKAPKENQRFSGAAAVVSRPPERERHNLTSDARLLCELWQSEQNRSTSSQGPVVFKQSSDGLRRKQGWEKAECRIETFCILTSFLHERRLKWQTMRS